jgi:hypothetical protein
MNPIRRVDQLIALATDPAASEEEARTAALAAAREIRKSGLKVTGDSPAPVNYYSPRAYSREYPQPQNERLLPGGRGLPPAAPRRAAPERQLSADNEEDARRRGVHILDLAFNDEPAARRTNDFAFPQALVQRRR